MRFLFLIAAIGFILVALIPMVLAATFAAFSLFGALLPWLAAGLFFWVLLGGGGGRRRNRLPRDNWRQRPVWSSAPSYGTRPAPTPIRPRPEANGRRELPIDVQVKAEQIRQKV